MKKLGIDQNKIKVLIVDDSSFIRSLVINVLKEDPQLHIIGECEDGDEVCSFLISHDVDAILMDISMKRMNGDQATLHVLKAFPNVKVIAYSSHQNQNYRNLMIGVGASGYVYKSTNLKVVGTVIKSVVIPDYFLELPIHNIKDVYLYKD